MRVLSLTDVVGVISQELQVYRMKRPSSDGPVGEHEITVYFVTHDSAKIDKVN